MPERSAFSACRISQHLRTNAELLGYFLPVKVEIEGETGEPGRVGIEGTHIPTPGKPPKT